MIRVLQTGSGLSIQDLGRTGFRRYGVPVSGAMDRISAMNANALAGNRQTEAVFEIFQPGHRLSFERNCLIALAGGEAEVYINQVIVYSAGLHTIRAGDEIRIGRFFRGCRLYMSVQGGLVWKYLLGGYSAIPGYNSNRLKKGDEIRIKAPSPEAVQLNSSLAGIQIDPLKAIRVLPGPEFDQLSGLEKKQVLSETYTITHHSDRMGYRLEGKPVTSLQLDGIISSAVMPGTVQMPPDGLPIILMRDCQTIGGYPRIFQIIEEDINQLAQRSPGQIVQFKIHQ